jgi:hypothetical protein
VTRRLMHGVPGINDSNLRAFLGEKAASRESNRQLEATVWRRPPYVQPDASENETQLKIHLAPIEIQLTATVRCNK